MNAFDGIERLAYLAGVLAVLIVIANWRVLLGELLTSLRWWRVTR